MKKFTELFEGYRYKLQNISYDSIESADTEDCELEISYVDNFNIVQCNDKMLTLDFCRKIVTSENILFNLSITYRIEHFINQEEIFNLEDYDIEEEVKNNLDMFSGNIMTKVSLLISEITSTFGNFPIITLPIVQIEE